MVVLIKGLKFKGRGIIGDELYSGITSPVTIYIMRGVALNKLLLVQSKSGLEK